MRKLFGLVAAVAMLAATSVASAADNAWFTHVGGAGTVVTSGPGQALQVNVEPGASSTVRVAYNFTALQYPDSNGQMASWAISLSTAPTSTADGGFAGGAQYLSTGYTNNVPGPEVGALLQAGQTSPAETGSAGAVYAFDITITNGVAGQILNIVGDFGPAEQFYANNGYAWYGFVGPNPISYGRVGYTGGPDDSAGWGSLPVIQISVVPEPATLGLIGLGALALIRRSR